MVVKNVDLRIGEVSLCLNEELISKKKSSEDALPPVEDAVKVTSESCATEQPQKKSTALAMSKYASMFPEKVSQVESINMALPNIFFLFHKFVLSYLMLYDEIEGL